MFSRKVALVGMVGAALAACSAESDNGNGSAGAASSNAGATGNVAGTAGTANGTAGTSGNNGGAAGDGSGLNGGAGGVNPGAGAGGASAGTGGTSNAGSSNAGTGGEAASGGTGGGGGVVRGPSPGCMANLPDEEIGQAVLHEIQITGMAQEYVAGYTNRKYCTTIPNNYDATKAYPVVFYGPGCGASGCEGSSFSGRDDIFLVQAIASADANGGNEVPPGAAPGCFQAGRVGTADSPEGPYFDQVIAEVGAKYCIDTSRVFAAGTSSGAWLSNYLACARGGAVRGTAADSGGLQFDHGECVGGAGVLNMPGDSAVTQQNGNEIGAALARDLFIQTNGCSTTPTQMQFGNDTCDVYGDCDSPVVWCDVGGGHQSGNSHLSPTGWAFWETLQ